MLGRNALFCLCSSSNRGVLGHCVQYAKEYTALNGQVELKQQEVALLEQRLAESQHGQLTARLQTLQEKLERDEGTIATSSESLTFTQRSIREFEAEIRDMEGAKERRLKVLSCSTIVPFALPPFIAGCVLPPLCRRKWRTWWRLSAARCRHRRKSSSRCRRRRRSCRWSSLRARRRRLVCTNNSQPWWPTSIR